MNGKKTKKFEPNIEILLDVITRRRLPERIPNYEPYYNPKTVAMVIGKSLPKGPFDSKDACRNYLQRIIEYQLTIKCDFIPVEVTGPVLPMKRELERTENERNDYLTQRDIPTILNRNDYEKYPWPAEKQLGLSDSDRMMIETAAELAPVGMGVLVSKNGIYEVLNYLLGYENFCYLLVDDPSLIDAMAARLGAINEKVFEQASAYEFVNILHMGDDIAFRGGTLVAPQLLRKWVFSWIKKYTDTSHKAGKVFTYHSDGNFKAVSEDIIAAGIDGKQAFEDLSYAVTDFKRDFGDRISVLGGIDVDKLSRFSEEELRKHVREVLRICGLNGGYAVGSGNCFATYIPVNNYMAMLEEAELYKY